MVESEFNKTYPFFVCVWSTEFAKHNAMSDWLNKHVDWDKRRGINAQHREVTIDGVRHRFCWTFYVQSEEDVGLIKMRM